MKRRTVDWISLFLGIAITAVTAAAVAGPERTRAFINRVFDLAPLPTDPTVGQVESSGGWVLIAGTTSYATVQTGPAERVNVGPFVQNITPTTRRPFAYFGRDTNGDGIPEETEFRWLD